ncbi:MAG: hypothetical protein WC543_06525 [Candidatus Omnitrophota bacterium]
MDQPQSTGPKLNYSLTAPWQLFSGSFKWYKDNFKIMLKMILLMVVPIIVFMLVAGLGFMIVGFLPALAGKIVQVVTVAISAVVLLFTIYFSFRGQMGMYLTIKDPRVSFKDNYRATKVLFWSGLGLSLLTSLLVLAWALLLIVPGIIFWVFYSLAFFIFIFEGTKGYSAIKASRQLVKGYFWQVFGRYLYFGLFMLIVSIIFAIPKNFMVTGGATETAYSLVLQFASYLLTPWFIVYSYFIYRDLKQIKAKA